MKFILFFLIIFSYCLAGYGQELYQDPLEKSAKSYLNQPCPEFTIKEWVSSKPKVKGKFVLIDFWTIWSYPCTHYSVPHLNNLAKKFKKDLVIIALSNENPFYIDQMVEPKIEYYNATVDSLTVHKTFGLTGYPFSYLIAPDGTVVWEGLTLEYVSTVEDKAIPRLTAERLEKIIADYKEKHKK